MFLFFSLFFTPKHLSDMGLHRKLIPEICETICHVEPPPCSSDCQVCLKFCLTNPQPYFQPSPPPPPPPPPLFLDDGRNHHSISTYLILAFAVVAASFFLVCCSAIYRRFFKRRTVETIQQTPGARDQDFLDEEHAPIVDHPIWYIRTPGLQQSIISAITVCKYKKGEGLIEGTDCSVCLSEFMEDESLRLLPKCNHAFHLPCIDTWLRSHTNCPLCRAPIVVNNAARVPSMGLEPNVVDSSSLENLSTQLELIENSNQIIGVSETLGGIGSSDPPELEVEDGGRRVLPQIENSAEEVVVSMRPRRSVSLDSFSAANINLALASVLSEGSDSDSNRALGGAAAAEQIVSKSVPGNENLSTSSSKRSSSFRIRYLHSVPSSMKRSSSYNGKYLLPWYGKSQTQKKPNATLRSF